MYGVFPNLNVIELFKTCLILNLKHTYYIFDLLLIEF